MSFAAYVTLESMKSRFKAEGTSFMDYDITEAINSASRAVDNYCKRRFDQTVTDLTEATVRYYTPQSYCECLINDVGSDDDIVLETDQDGDGDHERLWDFGSEYILGPLNSLEDGRVYTRLELNEYRASVPFPHWSKRSIKLTAKYGWPEVPSEVVSATGILTAKVLKRGREAPFGVVTVGIDVGAAVRILNQDPDIQMLINDLGRTRPSV